MSKTNKLGGLVGLLLAVVFMALALHNVDFAKLGASLATTNYIFVLPATLVSVVDYGLRTARWQGILRPAKPIAIGRLFPLLMIGFAANNLLPARMGELVRAYVLATKEGLSKTLSFATVVVERVFDGLSLVALLVIFSLFWPLPVLGEDARSLAILLFGGALLGLVLLILPGSPAIRLMDFVLRPFPRPLADRAGGMARSFVMGLAALRGGRGLAAILALSALVWLSEVIWYFTLSLGFDMAFAPWQRFGVAMFLLAIAGLGNILPAAPGFVGSYEFFVVLALSPFGVTKEVALSFAIVTHAVQFIFITGLGLIFLGREGISLWAIRAEI